jgi:hypothetical protein
MGHDQTLMDASETAKEKHAVSGTTWLIRISEIFADHESEIIAGLGAQALRKLGRDFHLIRIKQPESIRHSPLARYLRWNMPVHHSWPCNPRETDGFIEKAAQALLRKFGESKAQTLICGPIDPGSPKRYDRTLASNLRGRALQLFPREWSAIKNAEQQIPKKASLFCLVGKEGLYAGLQSPAQCDGFFPGGTKFIPQNSPDTISRAGAKIAEALHHLQLTRRPPPSGAAASTSANVLNGLPGAQASTIGAVPTSRTGSRSFFASKGSCIRLGMTPWLSKTKSQFRPSGGAFKSQLIRNE